MKIRFAALLLTPGFLLASTAQTTSKTTAKTSSKAASSKTAAKKRIVHKKGRYVASRRRSPASSFQTHPTPERYKEIQQSLADKGYFKGQVDGNWGDDSVSALKQFQTEHQLENDGKINSLSLIQLGLGPKHDGSAITNASPEVPPPPPPVTEAQPDDQPSAQ
jgi:peptidoglycan hydrolase-like protein with peptidoglycan-binding domain